MNPFIDGLVYLSNQWLFFVVTNEGHVIIKADNADFAFSINCSAN